MKMENGYVVTEEERPYACGRKSCCGEEETKISYQTN